MKLVFGVLLLIHGAIHLIGFVKAFYITEIDKQVLGIPKFIGALWLLVFILFIVAASSFFNNKKWFYLAFIAVTLSQILIISVWKEAKFGSIANIVILLVSMSAFGSHQFNKMVQKETAVLFKNIDVIDTSFITEKDIFHLPKIVQKWMKNSGAIGKPNITSVRLKQKGKMKTKPKGKWMPFMAKQYFNVETPTFIWTTKVENNPLLYMIGRDKLVDSKGEMLIKLNALIPVVNTGSNDKINQGVMVRFLAETCWFPSASLNDYIKWELMDDTSAKAVLTINNKSVSGIFRFNTKGNIISFETHRYFGGRKDAKLEKWVIDMIDYKTFNGIKIPNKCEVIWQLKEADFNWLNLEITDLEYNVLTPYKSNYDTK